MPKDSSSLQHSDGSADSRKWGILSPFSEDYLSSLEPITQDQIAYLLQQYTEHRRKSDLGFNLDVLELAECIFERTEGFPGLVGLCCSEVDSKNIISAEDWVRWCGVNLVTRVQQQRNYSVLSDTIGLLAMSTRNERLRQVMQMLLLQGSCMLERAEQQTVAERLLSEGIARISSKTSDKIEVSLDCPARHSLCAMCCCQLSTQNSLNPSCFLLCSSLSLMSAGDNDMSSVARCTADGSSIWAAHMPSPDENRLSRHAMDSAGKHCKNSA